jgi:hypothetical protein
MLKSYLEHSLYRLGRAPEQLVAHCEACQDIVRIHLEPADAPDRNGERAGYPRRREFPYAYFFFVGAPLQMRCLPQ